MDVALKDVLVVRYICSFDFVFICFWSFLLCFIYKSINQICSITLNKIDWNLLICCVGIIPALFLCINVLLFAGSGKLENQKTVLTKHWFKPRTNRRCGAKPCGKRFNELTVLPFPSGRRHAVLHSIGLCQTASLVPPADGSAETVLTVVGISPFFLILLQRGARSTADHLPCGTKSLGLQLLGVVWSQLPNLLTFSS